MSFEERLARIAQIHRDLAESVATTARMRREAQCRQAERDAKYNEHFTRVRGVVDELAALVKSGERRRIQDLEP